MSRPLSALLIGAILLLAFWLRVHDLAVQPLRGDEAFAVRYWAAPPGEVLQHLAWVEPHPLGTFVGFWAWRSLAGDGEFAMRLMPALLNLLGVVSVFAVARRLWRADGRAAWVTGLVASVAALLWAINPNLIWHSQDVRNYAPWAGLSAAALWLLVRAQERGRPRDWLLYVLAETTTLYVFFLEIFVLAAHLVYVLASARRGSARAQSRYPFAAYLTMAVLLIPWSLQALRLAGSGYGGTAARSDLGVLVTAFAPELLYGEPALSSLGAAIPGLFITGLLIVFVGLWLVQTRGSRAARLTLILLIVPPALLYAAGTRLDVFRPRYILAITPALGLALAAGVGMFAEFAAQRRGRTGLASRLTPSAVVIGWVLLLTTLFISTDALLTYFGGSYRKAPDWRALGVYLGDAQRDGVILLTAADSAGSVDPSFQYYYRGPFEVLPRTGVTLDAEVARLLLERGTIILVDQSTSDQTVRGALEAAADPINQDQAGVFRITTFRQR